MKKKEPQESTPSATPPTEHTPTPTEVTQLRTERDDLIDHLQRLQAEFDNYRKRIEREQEETRTYAANDLLHDILQISDAYDLALEHLPKDLHQDVYQGLLLVKDQLHKIINNNNLEIMQTDGEQFNPQFHEAIMTVDNNDQPKGTITQTFQRGYLRDGKVFRAAKVSVTK